VVTRSLGDDEVLVPNLVGFNAGDAREIARRLGLLVCGPDPDRPDVAEMGWADGVVVGQHPDPGAALQVGSTLVLWIEL